MQQTKCARVTVWLGLIALICLERSLSAQTKSRVNHAGHTDVPVLFVGCASDGQVGPLEAPSAKSKVMAISAGAAERLAYYKAEYGVGVLAPRGWHCLGTYGSNGATLYVSPDPINAADLLSTSWKGFAGPAIQISVTEGGTSGRFEVAKTIARVFPKHKAFVARVIAEGIEPATSFPVGPYPADTLKYKSDNCVEFWTPAGTDGLGTASRLLKNDSPISGVAILVAEEPSLIHLSIRVPSGASDLVPLIVDQTEQEAARPWN